MQVTLELPDSLVCSLGLDPAHAQRTVLEAVVAAGVRDATLSNAQARRLLNLSSNELDAFLKRHRASMEMTIEDLERDTARALAAANG